MLQYNVKCKIRTLGRDTHIAQKFSKANIFQCTQQSEIPREVDIVDILSHETKRQAKAVHSSLTSGRETEIMEVSHQRDYFKCNAMEQIINSSVDCHSAFFFFFFSSLSNLINSIFKFKCYTNKYM